MSHSLPVSRRLSWPCRLALGGSFWLAVVACARGSDGVSAISSPRNWQVVQRRSDNRASLPVTLTLGSAAASVEARIVVSTDSGSSGISSPWIVLGKNIPAGTLNASMANMAAGGWYQFQARALNAAGEPLGTLQSVDHVGIGEIFVTAGQSNAASFGSPPQTITDPRVSALKLSTNNWQVANDPQPDNSGYSGNGGSAWPRLGSRLAEAWNVPVGLVGVAYGGVGALEFLPSSNQNYVALRTAVQRFPSQGFRAVLWHQGESDALRATSSASYVSMLQTIISQTRKDAGWNIPWGIAQASFIVNSTYPAQEGVNAGQRILCFTTPGLFRGPRTDDFGYEGKFWDFAHFNTIGLTEHGDGWADILIDESFLYVKNGSFENGAVLAEGASRTGRIFSFNTFNSTGAAATDATTGVRNPDASHYSAAADTGPTQGVVPGMTGRQIGFLSGGSSGAMIVQQFPVSLQAGWRYEARVNFGIRKNTDTFAGYGVALLANGSVLAETTGGRSTLDSLAGGSATDRFTEVVLTWDSPGSVANHQALDLRIRSLAGGITSYLDIDNVRLTATPHPFTTWQQDQFGSSQSGAAAASADPDFDGLDNLAEFAFDRSPTLASASPEPISFNAGDRVFFIPRRRACPILTYTLEYSTDTTNWSPVPDVITQPCPLGTGFESATYLIPPFEGIRGFYRFSTVLEQGP